MTKRNATSDVWKTFYLYFCSKLMYRNDTRHVHSINSTIYSVQSGVVHVQLCDVPDGSPYLGGGVSSMRVGWSLG